MSRTGSEHSMPEGDADHPAVMPGQPGKAGGGTADGPGHAHQTGAVCNDTAEDRLSMTMEAVLRRENMLSAFQRVVGNAGAPGIDGMTVEDLDRGRDGRSPGRPSLRTVRADFPHTALRSSARAMRLEKLDVGLFQ